MSSSLLILFKTSESISNTSLFFSTLMLTLYGTDTSINLIVFVFSLYQQQCSILYWNRQRRWWICLSYDKERKKKKTIKFSIAHGYPVSLTTYLLKMMCALVTFLMHAIPRISTLIFTNNAVSLCIFLCLQN